MTIHEALFSYLREPLLGILYLLLTMQIALFFSISRDGIRRSVRLGVFLHLLLSLTLLWFPFLDIDGNRFRTDEPIPLPAARSVITELPVWSLFLYEAVTALILAVSIRTFLHWRKEHPTFESIKEAMDLLPAGIAFGRTDGTVIFNNLAMNSLSLDLTGKSITDLSAFLDKVGMTENESQLALSDGSAVWKLTGQDFDLDGKTYIQLTAADITKEAEIMRILEEKNDKLRDIQMRLKIYNQQAEKLIISQELLTARMAVHSELGSILLESRRYLNVPSSIDEEILMQALKHTNTYLLREYEQDDTAGDALVDALELARVIGVDVDITGVIPSDEEQRGILAAAITECATNTVKHADGNKLVVCILDKDDKTIFKLQTNGLPPKGKITESGGLLSLRELVEKANGSMTLDITPQVGLTISLQRPG